MCGEVTSTALRAQLDLASRCILDQNGVATRYIGLPDDILTEVRTAGFQVLGWKIRPRSEAEGEMDELQVWAARAPQP